MGRLLDALRAESRSGPLATPVILDPPRLAKIAESQESQPVRFEEQVEGVVRIAESQDNEVPVAAPHDTTNAARLLAAIRAEHLPDTLLGRDDARPEQLAELEPEELVAYVRALHATAEREAGRVPMGWDHAAHCDGCGPVWLWTTGRVDACPWCWNRRAHKPLPRPRVRCCDCQHYIADAINPQTGIGACNAGQTPAPNERPPWPLVLRVCGTHRPKDAR